MSGVDKCEKRAVMKYLFLKGMSVKAIHDDVLATLGDNASAQSVVNWRLRYGGSRPPQNP